MGAIPRKECRRSQNRPVRLCTVFTHGEHARCIIRPTQCNSPDSRPGGSSSPFAAYLLMGLPTMADFRPGGSRRFGAFLRSQCRSRGVWVPRSFFTASCSLGTLQTAATLDKQILDCPLCACPCSHTEPSLYYNSIARACQPAAPIICGLYSAPSPAAFSASRPPFS